MTTAHGRRPVTTIVTADGSRRYRGECSAGDYAATGTTHSLVVSQVELHVEKWRRINAIVELLHLEPNALARVAIYTDQRLGSMEERFLAIEQFDRERSMGGGRVYRA